MQLASVENIEFVEIDGDVPLLKNQPVKNLNNKRSANDLAYIIYTSGSTGRPKGVMIEHRALVDHCFGMIEVSGLKACKSFALFSPLVFDAGHSIIYSCFLLGSCLHVLSEDLVVNSERTAAYIDSHAIDCVKIVPSLWLSHAKFEKFILAKKVMVFGGESFALSVLTYLKKANYGGTVFNHYGPTEATIGKCIYKVDLNKTYTVVPIGKAFSNTRLYVLDEYLQLVPVGIAGELCIAGDGLARGYLNRENVTAEKFIVNPFAAGSMDKMYRTGDKVRWLPEGNIEHLGRTDEQVKIRGHRIELGEIEDALLRSKLVRQGAVLAIDDKKGNRRLVAYIVPESDFTSEAITAFLKKRLPEYMIPLTFVELRKIPLTVNGKINKKDLETLAATDRGYTAPQTGSETQLAIIWQNLLKIERISIFDNFFELGGNSIDGARMISKIKKKFGKSFPLAFIFNAPTIHQLAAALQASPKSIRLIPHLVPIQPKGSKTPVFAMHAGHGNIIFYANLSLHLGPDQPFYALQAKGVNGFERPMMDMKQMAAYYLSEIRKVQPKGPYYLVGYCLGAQIAFEIAKQLILEGQKIALLANFNGVSPIFNRRNLRSAQNGIPHAGTANAPGHVKKLTLRNRAGILKRKSIRAARMLLYILLSVFNAVVFEFCLFFRLKPPGLIARLYVARFNFQMQKKYYPEPYPGSMMIFRSPEIYKEPYLGWKTFIKGDIKTFDIPGKHKTRRDVMNEPHVQILAKELQNFLEK
jgi:amino acid adenylation domain-containing protein